MKEQMLQNMSHLVAHRL